MLLLCVFGVVTLDVLIGGPLRVVDHDIDRWVKESAPDHAVLLSRTHFVLPGQRLVCVPPMAVMATVLAWRRRTWRPLLVALAVMGFLALVVPGMKMLTGRTNPLSGDDKVWAGGTEYPSGHEINAIVVWGMCLAMAAGLDWSVGRWLTPRRQVMLTAVVAAWVGSALVVARTHWFSDIVASVCIGVPLLWAVLRCGFVRPTPASDR